MREAASYANKILPGSRGGPALFVFHGTGGGEDQLAGLGRSLMPHATVIAPRGDVSEAGAPRFFRRRAEGVYDMDDLARATAKMAAFIRARTTLLAPASVFGLGYSNGANLLASLVFSHPGLFDAVVLMHPLIPFSPKIDGSLAGRFVLITAGRRDPICPPHLTERLETGLREAGADVTLVWHEGGHETRPQEFEAARQFLAQTTNRERTAAWPTI